MQTFALKKKDLLLVFVLRKIILFYNLNCYYLLIINFDYYLWKFWNVVNDI